MDNQSRVTELPRALGTSGMRRVPSNASRWRLDPFRRRLATPDGTPIQLTRREMELMDLLCSNQGEAVSRDTIARTLMGREWLPGDRSMDVLVRRLRDKIDRYTGRRDLIRTERNIGYSLAGSWATSG